jgi:uncharacterized cupin superfamily protein
MTSPRYPVLNIDEVEEQNSSDGVYWRGSYKSLTPWMEANGGAVCVNVSRLPPGCVGCPFHYHMVDDEVFYILSGTGVLRYGDQLIPIRPGDTISCPAGSRIAHQIANTGNEDLVYLGIGANSPNEVCYYPDSNKVMVRSLKTVGTLTETDYMDGEPERPLILDMAKKLSNAGE